MAALSINDAAERLAKSVEKAKPTALSEYFAELFPEEPSAAMPSAAHLAHHVRSGLEPEELVDLWNVVFPEDRNVWYDEEDHRIHYNEESIGYAEAE